jgi:hypothetical protein
MAPERKNTVKSQAEGDDLAPKSSKNMVVEEALTRG